MEGQGLAVAMGQVAGGVTQQAGLVWVVSHCQLSLPGWDCHSHLVSHWLHWEHQTTAGMKKHHFAPKAPHRHGGAALDSSRSPPPSGQISHGSARGEAPSLVQALEGPHPAPCQRVQTFGRCCVPVRPGRPQGRRSWHTVYPGAVYTSAPYGNGLWRHEPALDKDGEAAVFAMSTDCWPEAVGQRPGRLQASAASTPCL